MKLLIKSMANLLLLGTVVVAHGQAIYSTNLSVNSLVPDNNANGYVSGITVSGLSGVISNVTVNLDITGGNNGDLYAYLLGPNGGFSILLNRVGVGNSSLFGYRDSGFNVQLSDSAANGSIHYYQNVLNPNGGQLTGVWQPDGKNIDPQSSPANFVSAGQTALLSSFDGTDGNGRWLLFMADLSAGDQSTLVSWGLGMNIVGTPEPQMLSVLAMGGLFLVVFRKRLK